MCVSCVRHVKSISTNWASCNSNLGAYGEWVDVQEGSFCYYYFKKDYSEVKKFPPTSSGTFFGKGFKYIQVKTKNFRALFSWFKLTCNASC